MNWKKLTTYLLLQTILSIAAVCHGAAVPQLTLIPGSSGNVFTLQGTNLEGLAAMDFEFSYDTAAMKNPQAVRGNLFPSDAIFNFNPFAPGEIRLFTKIGKTALNSSGTVATITFEGVENAQGSLLIVNTNLINSATGKSILARVQTMGRPAQTPQPKPETPQDSTATAQTVQPSSDQTATATTTTSTGTGTVAATANQTVQESPDQTATATTTTSTGTGTATATANQAVQESHDQTATATTTTSTETGTVTATANQTIRTTSNQTRAVTSSASSTLGTVMLPASQPEKETIAASKAPVPSEAQPAERQATASPAQYRAAPETSVPAPAVPLKNVTYQSVLERVKVFSGARTPQALADLFKPASGQLVRQEPAVAISDGESVVSLRVELPLNLKETPSFSLRKASMVSLQQADDGSWLIEARPLKNTIEARLTINCDGSTVQFPLVVAPPLEPDSVVSNGSTEEGFIRYLKSKEPGSDLNGDGRFDYVDDYIFTANYLARHNDSKPKPTGEKLP